MKNWIKTLKGNWITTSTLAGVHVACNDESQFCVYAQTKKDSDDSFFQYLLFKSESKEIAQEWLDNLMKDY